VNIYKKYTNLVHTG